MFPLFETIHIENGVALNLSFHQERVTRTFRDLFPSSGCILQLASVLRVPGDFGEGSFRCRLMYNETEWSTEFIKYIPRKVTSLKLIRIDEIDYPHKFTNRNIIDKVFSSKGSADDILIVKNGKLTDTSIANILFRKEDKWYTPDLPLLEGTCRARLLNEGIISEKDITINNFREYSHFMLINALNDFDLKRIQPVESIIN